MSDRQEIPLIGSIPLDWSWAYLGEISTFSQYGLNTASEAGAAYPMLRMNNLQNGIIDTTDLVYVPLSDEELAAYQLAVDDLLINRTNSYDLVGKVALFELPGNYVFASYLVRFRFDLGTVFPKFMHYFLNSETGKALLKSFATKGVSQANLNPTTLKKKLPIPLPPLPEQRKIAAILSTWDEAITLTEQLIAALTRRKQALMQRLLTGAVRFPEFEGEWEEVELGQIANVNADTVGEKIDPNKEFFYIDLSSVDHGTIEMPTQKIPFGELPSRARRVLHFGDIIMSTVRPNLLGFAQCNFEPLDIICSTGFALLSPHNLGDSNYIYQNLYSDSILKQIQDLVTGSNYPAINANEVKKLRLPFPGGTVEREKIGDALQACDIEMNLLSQLIGKLKEQKRGLMQQLLTGAVRVRVEE